MFGTATSRIATNDWLQGGVRFAGPPRQDQGPRNKDGPEQSTRTRTKKAAAKRPKRGRITSLRDYWRVTEDHWGVARSQHGQNSARIIFGALSSRQAPALHRRVRRRRVLRPQEWSRGQAPRQVPTRLQQHRPGDGVKSGGDVEECRKYCDIGEWLRIACTSRRQDGKWAQCGPPKEVRVGRTNS